MIWGCNLVSNRSMLDRHYLLRRDWVCPFLLWHQCDLCSTRNTKIELGSRLPAGFFSPHIKTEFRKEFSNLELCFEVFNDFCHSSYGRQFFWLKQNIHLVFISWNRVPAGLMEVQGTWLWDNVIMSMFEWSATYSYIIHQQFLHGPKMKCIMC